MMVGDCARGDVGLPIPARGMLAREGPANGIRGREKEGDCAGRDGERRLMPGGRVRDWEGEKVRGEGERVEGDEAPAAGKTVGDMAGEGI